MKQNEFHNLKEFPQEQINDMYEYFSNIKLMWNKDTIRLTKKEIKTMNSFFKKHNELFGNEKYLEFRKNNLQLTN